MESKAVGLEEDVSVIGVNWPEFENAKEAKETVFEKLTESPEKLAEFLSVIDINRYDQEWWLKYLQREWI